MFISVGAGLFMLPLSMTASFGLLFPLRFGMVFCSAGIDPVFQSWLAKVTSEERRGFIFGWAATARSIGWMLAPIASGVVAAGWGTRSVFIIGAILFFLLVPLILKIVKRVERAGVRGTPA